MKLILCPTDFSPSALHAARYACGLASTFKARIVLLHSFESAIMYSEMPFTSIKDADQQMQQAMQKKLNAQMQKLKREFKSLSFEIVIARGLSHQQIVKSAKKLKADMIILGATGTSKLERLLMGSTTAKVIRDAHCPVLSVPLHAEYSGIKKIVFSTDLKEDNVHSAQLLIPFAKKLNAEIAFLFIDDKNILHDDKEVEKIMGKIKKRIHYPALSGYISKYNSVSKGIESFLGKSQADMLAMFTHPKHFPESLFHSSMTQLMSHHTGIPLLALKKVDKSLIGS